jgi:hypothetical protein
MRMEAWPTFFKRLVISLQRKVKQMMVTKWV